MEPRHRFRHKPTSQWIAFLEGLGTGVPFYRNPHVGGESPRFTKSLPAPEFDRLIEHLLIRVILVLLFSGRL